MCGISQRKSLEPNFSFDLWSRLNFGNVVKSAHWQHEENWHPRHMFRRDWILRKLGCPGERMKSMKAFTYGFSLASLTYRHHAFADRNNFRSLLEFWCSNFGEWNEKVAPSIGGACEGCLNCCLKKVHPFPIFRVQHRTNGGIWWPIIRQRALQRSISEMKNSDLQAFKVTSVLALIAQQFPFD